MMRNLFIILLCILCWSTLQAQDDRGIGGTGMPVLSLDDRGIGGTGIIGTITEFGSIWVNGIEVEYDDNTRVFVDDEPGSISEFRLGQQVAVLANQIGEQWFASEVHIQHTLIGTVEAVNSDSVVVNGYAVQRDSAMPGQWQDVEVGQRIKVSGYFDDGVVYATDVAASSQAQQQSEWEVTGPVVRSVDNQWTIGGHLTIPGEELGVRPGDVLTVEVTGRVNRYTPRPQPFAGRAQHYSIEKRSRNGNSHIDWSEGVDTEPSDSNQSFEYDGYFERSADESFLSESDNTSYSSNENTSKESSGRVTSSTSSVSSMSSKSVSSGGSRNDSPSSSSGGGGNRGGGQSGGGRSGGGGPGR